MPFEGSGNDGNRVDDFTQPETTQGNSAADLIERVDFFRVDGFGKADPGRRTELGQFSTPPTVARFMASLFVDVPSSVRLLDAGAGVGSLTAAVVADLICRKQRPADVSVMAFEIDQQIADYLTTTLGLCGEACRQRGIEFSGSIRTDDFIRAAASMIADEMFGKVGPTFNLAVLETISSREPV